ncbi:hypothetical protein AB7M17_001471 [Bradyrhizobium sp. USDA 377]
MSPVATRYRTSLFSQRSLAGERALFMSFWSSIIPNTIGSRWNG